MEDFTTRLNRAMFLKGMNQSELAEKTGFNKGDISHYAKGHNIPTAKKIAKIAEALGVTSDWLIGKKEIPDSHFTKSEAALVPVLGKVAAGMPTFASQDIIDSVMFDGDTDGLFALKIKGDSMSPRILDGDIVIVRSQSCAEDGDLVIAIIGDETTCKVFRKNSWGVSLVPFNPVFQPIVVSHSDIDTLHILGVVIESRHRW